MTMAAGGTPITMELTNRGTSGDSESTSNIATLQQTYLHPQLKEKGLNTSLPMAMAMAEQFTPVNDVLAVGAG
jgi:hypothetical protein